MSSPILALDVGSTSVKAARFNEVGQRIGPVVSERHRASGGRAGFVDANALLRAAIRCLERLDLIGIQVVATSAVWHAVVPADAQGNAYGEAVTWEAALSESFRAKTEDSLTGVWSHRESGAHIHSSFPLVTWPMLRAAGAPMVVDLGSWVIGRLAGVSKAWPENVAAGTGLWAQPERQWNAPAFARLDIEPPRDLWQEPVVTTDNALVDLPGVLWLPPVGDGLCHNLGEQVVSADIAVTVGTSGSLRTVATGETSVGPAHGLWRYRCDESTVVTGGAVTSAGNVFEWIRTVLGGPVAWSELSLERLTALPIADASIFGRRGPDYPWGATGSISGVHAGTTASDLGLAWGLDVWRVFHAHYKALRKVRGPEQDVVAAGGALNADPLCLQVLADSLGTTVVVSAEDQPALRGAALVAADYLMNGSVSIDSVVASVMSDRFEKPERRLRIEPREELTVALHQRWAR